jgi:hypothetical protein
MVGFDSTFLTFLFVPNAPCSVDRARDRIEFLISDLHGKGERIIIPTPALSEILIKTGHATQQILHDLTHSPKFVIAPFDIRAALEVALMAKAAQKKGDKRGGATGSWAKVKYDRQIVAITKVFGGTVIYSEDEELCKFAIASGLKSVSVRDLSLPFPKHEGPGLFD